MKSWGLRPGGIVLTLLFGTGSLQAQSTYRGVVQDAQNQNPVPYATVGLIQERIGVTTDITGQFELTSPRSQPGDTLLFQALGYQSLKLAVSAFSGKNVFLVPSVQELEEVQIKPRVRNQMLTLNAFSPKSAFGTQSSDGETSQIAQHFQPPTSTALLNQVIVYTKKSSLKGHRKGHFRVRIYSVDSGTGGPGTDLCQQSIECVNSATKLVVDLRPYKILLPENEFFVAVEWLKIPENEYTIQEISDANRSRTRQLYDPSVAVKRRQTDGVSNCWMKGYQGIWHHINNTYFSDYGIEAQIHY